MPRAGRRTVEQVLRLGAKVATVMLGNISQRGDCARRHFLPPGSF